MNKMRLAQGYHKNLAGIIGAMTRICIYPHVTSMGGVGSFRMKFSEGLRARGIEVTHDLDDPHMDFILILAGTKNLAGLWRAKRRGIPIIQRLDGINWIQRKRWTGFRHFVRAEYGNIILAFIRHYIADSIIYQSAFSRNWWNSWYANLKKPSITIHNGVDLTAYSPKGMPYRQEDRYRLLLVEGSLEGGYDMGVINAIHLVEKLADEYDFPMELTVVGKISIKQQDALQKKTRVPITWLERVLREQIPEIDRSAHLFFSADLNAACPNAVIEALACGTPVVSFDTGALRELVPPTAGKIVPYGGSPWELDAPDIPTLAKAAAEVLREQERFRAGARAHAEDALGLEKMVADYLKFFFGEELV